VADKNLVWKVGKGFRNRRKYGQEAKRYSAKLTKISFTVLFLKFYSLRACFELCGT